MSEQRFMGNALREFRRHKALAERAMAQVDDVAFFAAAGSDSNSLATIVKHVAGNLRSRWREFLTTDGEKPDRQRDTEFVVLEGDTRESLMMRWEEGWAFLFEALEPLSDNDLERVVTIRGEPLSVLQAVIRQLTHYAYHVGQIVLLAKAHVGDGWRSLSIPRGTSAQFNQQPAKYL